MKAYQWILTAIVACALVGCGSVLISSRVNLGEASGTERRAGGIPYFLPKGKVRILAIREAQPIPDRANPNYSGAMVRAFHILTNQFSGDEKALASNHLSLFIYLTNSFQTKLDKRYEYTVSMTEVIEPDPDALFLLHPAESAFADDTFNIKVEKGLLQSINSTNVDQTGNFILKVAELGMEAFKLASGGLLPGGDVGTKRQGEQVDDVAPDYPPVLDLIFNPLNPEERKKANRELARARLEFGIVTNTSRSANKQLPDYLKKEGEKVSGVFYRPAFPYQAEIRTAQGSLTAKALRTALANQLKEQTQSLQSESNLLVTLGWGEKAKELVDVRWKALDYQAGVIQLAAEKDQDKDKENKDKEDKDKEDKGEKPASPQPEKGETPADSPASDAKQLAGVIQKTLFLPNEAPVLGYDLRRAALVTKGSSLIFQNGSLVEVGVSKPSEALEGVKIPLTIVKSIVALPTDLIQLKINLANSNNNLINAQAGQFTALSNYLVAQNLLEQLRKATNPPATSGTNVTQ
jgi:hypothetical protein